ncbi:MAG: hypothetical protein EOP81_02800 [Variovorax sp.]|nr:MAG: hypothetical protein EOP81_02800 [Variovorax sp.]
MPAFVPDGIGENAWHERFEPNLQSRKQRSEPVTDAIAGGASLRVPRSGFLLAGFDFGALHRKLAPRSSVAIVGASPLGLSALFMARLCAPLQLIMIDLDDGRLAVAARVGASATVNCNHCDAAREVMRLTAGRGVDIAVEASGFSAALHLCEEIIAASGRVASVTARCG